MKVCPRCSSSAESKFCPECGFDLSAVAIECNETNLTDNEIVGEEPETEFVDIKPTEVNDNDGNVTFEGVITEAVPETEVHENEECQNEGSNSSYSIQATVVDEPKQKVYEKSWFIILMLFILFPVGAYLMWKRKKFGKVVRVIASIVLGINFLWWTLVFVVLMLPCDHEWVEATCTSPKYCSLCDETEGVALGHSEGDWNAESADGVKATISYSKKCTVCDETIDTKTEDLNTLVSGDTFYMTPSEFVERLDNKLSWMEGNNLEATEGETEGKFACGILEDGDKVGVILFTDGESAIGTAEQNDECVIESMLGTVDNNDSTARVLVALIETCDPSISFDDAKELAKRVADSGEETKNGITYMYLSASDGTILGVAVED